LHADGGGLRRLGTFLSLPPRLRVGGEPVPRDVESAGPPEELLQPPEGQFGTRPALAPIQIVVVQQDRFQVGEVGLLHVRPDQPPLAHLAERRLWEHGRSGLVAARRLAARRAAWTVCDRPYPAPGAPPCEAPDTRA